MIVYQVNERFGERKFFSSKREVDKYYVDLFLSGKRIETKEWDLRSGDSLYRVHINDVDCPTEINAMVCVAKSENRAKSIGDQYIKDWGLYDKRIIKIEKVDIV